MAKITSSKDGVTLFIRNVPLSTANKMRRYVKNKRTTLAGALIELVDFAEASGWELGPDNNSN